MNREQSRELLKELGVENPTSMQVTGLLNAIKEDKDAAVKSAVEQTEAKYKDFVKPDDHKKLQDEIATLKDSSAKAERTAKYKDAKLADKWHEHADSILKDSKDFDNDLKKFVKDNPELLVQKAPNPKTKEKEKEATFQDYGSSDNNVDDDFNSQFRAAFGL